ncbi:fungal-specific transcription factor domain-containing protein [Auriculariales sp. MPI-PUGE-AT-0066]|nr:fungal-specific transcription factor domain-containing protein [Auriculariales sp. MPI-PUGE-AT-0066]
MSAINARTPSRPCDHCRRGKRACDGCEQANLVCSRCKQLSKVCTYNDDPVRRSRSAAQNYIAALELRLESVEALLRRNVPAVLLMRELGTLTMSTAHSAAGQNETTNSFSISKDVSPPHTLEQWEEVMIALSQQHPERGFKNLQAPWHTTQTTRRMEFWHTPYYEFRMERPEDRNLDLVLPAPDRLAILVQSYFDNWNANLPIFHRGLFEKQLLDIRLPVDKPFAVAVLLVCALGESRLADDTEHQHHEDPPGLGFFCQAEPFLRVPTPAEPRLLDIQIFFLATWYMALVRSNYVAWTLLSTGIRLAYLSNAHRRDKYNQPINLQDELWKRTFWALVVTDRMASSAYGRPLIIKDETFNLDLPLEVDDDCWDVEVTGLPFRGALSNNLSQYSFFVANIRLNLISGFVTRTIYSINRSRLLMGFTGSDWEQRITNNLDHMLDDWAAAVPFYLRWNPDSVDLTRFVQSSFLTVNHHVLRIHAHNPFLRATAQDFSRADPSSRTAARLAASLKVCTTAAAACGDVMKAVVERYPRALRQAGWADPTFVCGLVLMVNLFGFRSSLGDQDVRRFTAYAETFLEALNIISSNYPVAEQKRNTLSRLISELQPLSEKSASQTISVSEHCTVPSPQVVPLPALSSKQPKPISAGDHGLLPSDQISAATSFTSPVETDFTRPLFCMDALPLELGSQISAGRRDMIPIYPFLNSDRV